MSSRKKHDGSGVTRQECFEAMDPIKSTLIDVKNALIGKDLRSGLVQQVNNLDNKVTNIITQWETEKKENEKKHQENLKLKLAILSLAATFLGFFLKFVLSHFGY